MPFGEDLLWPPHLLIYASFLLNVAMVGFGLTVALRGPGGLRARFRREPLLAMLGLLAAFGFAFIPVDVAWHQVIGPDLTAASPPHMVGAISGTAVALVGVALVLSTTPTATWRRLVQQPWAVNAVALGILATLGLNWLQLLTTEWDWANQVAESRPAWIYPLLVGVIGAAVSHLALHTTRRIGAATAVAVVNLALHGLAVTVFRAYLPPGPIIAAHVVLVPAAVALDVWYAARGTQRSSNATLVLGALIYAAVLLGTLLLYAEQFMTVPSFEPLTALVSVIVTAPAILLASLICARLGAWLGNVGRPHPTLVAKLATSPSAITSRALSHELAAR